jgi:hypothetical protein
MSDIIQYKYQILYTIKTDILQYKIRYFVLQMLYSMHHKWSPSDFMITVSNIHDENYKHDNGIHFWG